MLTLEQARDAVLSRIRTATRREKIPLARANGRYLAAPVQARVDNPAFDNSAMDGYALRAADLDLANSDLTLSGEAACGDAPDRLTPGTTMRIFTGAPLPAGADTVVMQEDVERDGDRIRFPADVAVGAHIRRAGEDFRRGDALYDIGYRLSAPDLALLACAGVAEPEVFVPPRVLVLATGDELVAPGQELQPGQIYESNRIATCALLADLGIRDVDSDTVADDPATLRERLQAANDYDFIITSGGASVGDHDLVRPIFGELGRIEFWKARVKPGKPVAFGQLGDRAHFFALPGNPVSSLVTFRLFVEPALVHWHHGRHASPSLAACALAGFRRKPGRREFLRAQLTVENGTLCARPLPGQGSHQLAAFRHCNGYIVVAEESDGFNAGDTVNVEPMRPISTP